MLWVCQVVTPLCRSDQTRPVLALPPVYFGNGMTLFGIPIRPYQADITIPPPRGGACLGFPDFTFSGLQVPYHGLMLSSNSSILLAVCFYQWTRRKDPLPLLVAYTLGSSIDHDYRIIVFRARHTPAMFDQASRSLI